MKKTIFSLAVDNYAPEITQLTFPLIRRYADKIGAEFVVIKDRKFPNYPPVYEKLQIFQLGKEMGNDWNIYIDADALVHPDMFDVTEHLPKDVVLHHGSDMAGNRWKYDNYFRRDGRHIGSCNWFTIASDWCLDLWRPLEDLTVEQAVENIYPLDIESKHGVERSHLIDDYTLSRNIARYGLKFTTLMSLLPKIGRDKDSYFYHEYLFGTNEKIAKLSGQIESWGITNLYKNFPKTLLAQQLPGWMSFQELQWLGQQAQTRKQIVEIGSYHGRSTRALGDNTKGVVYAVDTWEGSEEHQSLSSNIDSYKQFCINLKDLMDGPEYKVRPIKMDSVSAATKFFEPNMKFDMIFIDGSHDYESVKADILAWRPRLAPGGLLCGHDYGNVVSAICDASKFGVTRAVDELIPNIQKGPDSLWYATF